MNKKILKISNISNLGHGIAFDDFDQKIFVPKAISGDEIEVEISKRTNKFTSAKIIKILKESEFRTNPECEYFLRCGGCSLQHLNPDFYLEFKKKNILDSLAKNNIELKEKLEFVEVGKGSRRRVNFQITKDNQLGFFTENSNDLVKINHCLMLEKALSNLILPLQHLLKKLPKNLVSQITGCKFDNVTDVILSLKKGEISLEIIEILTDFAKTQNINLSYFQSQNLTPIYQITKPQLDLGSIKISVPANIFLQATKKGQEEIIKRILQFVSKNNCKNIADFYCGIGTYSFPLLEKANKINAFEGEEKMTNSINSNAKTLNLTHKIIAQTRDLVVSPLQTSELKNFDLAIINPPRNGAKAQILKFVESEIKNIIMVSCNLDSFIQDSKILIENGFKMKKLTAIDQFYYTTHIELIAIFTK